MSASNGSTQRHVLHSGLSLDHISSCGLLTQTCSASNTQLGGQAQHIRAGDGSSRVSIAQLASAVPIKLSRALILPHITSTRVLVGQVKGISQTPNPGPEALDIDTKVEGGAPAWGGVSLPSHLSLVVPIADVRGPENSQAISIGRPQNPMVSPHDPQGEERPRERLMQAVSGIPSLTSTQMPRAPDPATKRISKAVALVDGHHTGAIDNHGPPQLTGAPGAHDRAISDAFEVQRARGGVASGLHTVDDRQIGHPQLRAEMGPLIWSRQALVQTPEVVVPAMELTSSGGGGAGVLRPAACEVEHVTYHVTVRTKDRSGAGTEEPAMLRITGSWGHTGDLPLLHGRASFECGSVAVCCLQGKNVGMLQCIQIGLDTLDPSALWVIEEAVMHNDGTGETVYFQKRNWKARGGASNAGGLCFRSDSKPCADKEPAPSLSDDTMRCRRIGMAQASALELELLNIAKFSLIGRRTIPDDVSTLQASWRQGAFSPSFSAAPLKLTHQKSLLPYIDQGVQIVKHFEATVRPSPVGSSESPASAVQFEQLARRVRVWDAPGYSITFHTSNTPMGGTNSEVTVEMIGRSATTGPLLVSNPGRRALHFKAGHATTAVLRALPSVGELVELRVGTDGGGLFPAWHLRSVDVEHLPSGMVFVFPCGRWIDRWCGNERILWSDQAEAGRIMQSRAQMHRGPRALQRR